MAILPMYYAMEHIMSTSQRVNVYQAWERGLPASEVAAKLRLAHITVIRLYLMFDGGAT